MSSITMSNFHLDITARGEDALEIALNLALMTQSYATHWCDHPYLGLVLYWSTPEDLNIPPQVGSLPPSAVVGRRLTCNDLIYEWTEVRDKGDDRVKFRWVTDHTDKTTTVHPFPYKMKKAADLAKFVHGWLEEASYGSKPDIDGSCAKGFRVYNDQYGQVKGCGPYSFVCVVPTWAEIHK